MKVLVITALYPPAVGGAATYFGDIVPQLAQRDEIEQLTILTEYLPGQAREWAEGKLGMLRYLPTRVSLPQRRWLTHAATYALTQLWFAVRLPGLVRQRDVDLIHFHTRYRGRLFYAALQRCGVPVIADLRDKMTNPAQLASIADRLLCCGEGVQRFAIDGGFPAERTTRIPIPFVPPEVPSPEQLFDVRRRYGLGDRPYLLFVGDITYNKGVYDLLETYQRWRTEHPQARLVLVGVNREGGHFLKQVQRTVGAIYLGHVAYQDALTLVRGAEIVILPSRSEGLPRVILEAVSLGTKVICPPGIPEFEGHLPQFVLPNVDADSIFKMLNTVWCSDSLPLYPILEHSVDYVVEETAKVYSQPIERKIV